jgi:ribose transport system substrate-binding protein
MAELWHLAISRHYEGVKDMKNLRMTLAVLVLGMFVAVCGTTAIAFAASANTDSVGPKRVALLLQKLNSEFWVEIERGVKDKCAEYGWKLDVLCPVVSDSNEEQIQLVEQSLINPPDIYIISPADFRGIIPAIEEINKANIPIINYNSRIMDESLKITTFVGLNKYDLAKQSAEALIQKLGGKGKLLLLEGLTGSQTANDIKNGAMSAFDAVSGIEVLASMPANYLRTDGMTVTQDLLQKFPQVDGLFAANLESALGASEAMRQANRAGIKIATLNISEEGARALKNGTISLIMDDDPYGVGTHSVEAAYKYFSGETLPETINLEGTLVDESNLEPYEKKYGLK